MDVKIIDLGIEFVFDVNYGSLWFEVIDGEVELCGGDYDGEYLVIGEGVIFSGMLFDVIIFDGLSMVFDF